MLILSCDVGSRRDFAALVGLEVHAAYGGETLHRVVYADRQLGLSVSKLADAVITMRKHFMEAAQPRYGTVIPVIDMNGSGAGCFDLTCDAGAKPLGIRAVGGAGESRKPHHENDNAGMSVNVSNDRLMRSLRYSAVENNLQFAEDLPYKHELEQELLLTVPELHKKGKGRTFNEAPGQHDDLAAALMMACYSARWLDTMGPAVMRFFSPQIARREDVNDNYKWNGAI